VATTIEKDFPIEICHFYDNKFFGFTPQSSARRQQISSEANKRKNPLRSDTTKGKQAAPKKAKEFKEPGTITNFYFNLMKFKNNG
jgi:hypothetical protein